MNNYKRQIGFIGFGKLGKQIADMLEQDGFNKSLFRYFDNDFSHPVAYKFNDFLDDEFSKLEFVVALGYKHLDLKDKIIKQLISFNRNILSFYHPTSYISHSAKIGRGVIIYPMCNIDQNVSIEDGVLINNSVTISHNCYLGSSGYYSPGVILSGEVTVGNATFVGSGTIVTNGVHVGANCSIGIGTVVTKNLPDNISAIGNPARQLNHALKIL